jgi:hypothetical protein
MFIGLLGTLWMDVKILNEKKGIGCIENKWILVLDLRF